MMDAKGQEEAAARLGAALRRAGLVVSRAAMEGGNVQRWEEVSPSAALFAWQAKGWRVDMVERTPTPLALVSDEQETDHG